MIWIVHSNETLFPSTELHIETYFLTKLQQFFLPTEDFFAKLGH